MLVRARPGAGAEVYMLRRQRSMAFAPGAYVFPGGSVDDSDTEGGHGWAGPPPASSPRPSACRAAGAEALIRAAVRETFEECGVLLAGPSADVALGGTVGRRLGSGPAGAGGPDALARGAPHPPGPGAAQ